MGTTVSQPTIASAAPSSARDPRSRDAPGSGLTPERPFASGEREEDAVEASSRPTGHDFGGLASGRESGTPVIQRDVGFEFETPHILTKRRNRFRGRGLPSGAFANGNDAAAAWRHARTTRIDKGDALLKGRDMEVQADDRGANSDLEVVTEHFPETGPGRARLAIGLQRLNQLIQRHDALQVAEIPAGVNVVTAKALNNTAGFRVGLRDSMIGTGLQWANAQTAPQVTLGTRLETIPNLVRDLHANPAHPAAVHVNARTPGRLLMRREDPGHLGQPVPLVGGALQSEARTLVDGNVLARQAIANFQANFPAAPGGRDLEGFLTLVFTYREGVPRKMAFLKSHTPLMAKTDLATAWSTLPRPTRDYYAAAHFGTVRLVLLVASAPGYAPRVTQSLFEDVPAAAALDENVGLALRQWYHELTLQDWLIGITRGRDQLTTENFPDIPRDQEIEGYGALGERMDTDVTTGADLPVFELRSATKMVPFRDLHTWALPMFDYIRSLNANPAGGYNFVP